jgi:hypothetical protein
MSDRRTHVLDQGVQVDPSLDHLFIIPGPEHFLGHQFFAEKVGNLTQSHFGQAVLVEPWADSGMQEADDPFQLWRKGSAANLSDCVAG